MSTRRLEGGLGAPLPAVGLARYWWHRLMGALAAGWQRLRALARTLVLIRFSLILGLGCGWALIANDQAQDALRLTAEDPGAPLLALVLAALFCAGVVWYAARVIYYFDFGDGSTPTIRCIKTHLPRVLGALVLALPGLAALVAASAYESHQAPAPLLLWALAGLLLALALGFYLAVLRRRRWLVGLVRRHRRLRRLLGARFARRPESLAGLAALPRTGQIFLGTVALIGLGLMAHFAVSAVASARLFGAAAIGLLAVASVQPFGSLLDYLGNRYKLPTLSFVLLWAVWIAWLHDNHLVRLSADMASHAVPAADRPPALPNPEPAAHFERWVAPLRKADDGPVPVFVVAAEGGGIRAAYWTAQVLGELQDRACAEGLNFARHLFAISGVSGGSLGAATFAALLAERLEGGSACAGATDYRARAERILAADFLAPTLAVMLFSDTFQMFLPLGIDDRAVTLEAAWERAWRLEAGNNRLAAPFLDLWAGLRRLEVPALFLNSTVVETGQRLIAAPLDVSEPAFSEALDATEVLGRDLPLSTAIHNSARFTYISPAGTVRRLDQPDHWLRLVDGGYFENSGAVTAAEIVRLIEAAARALQIAVAPIVLHISNDPEVFGPGERSGRRVLISQARAPIEALFNTRPARGAQAREALSRQVAQHLHFRLCRESARRPLPLGWALSSAARAELARQLGVTADASTSPNAERNRLNFEDALILLRGGRLTPSGADAWTCEQPGH
jgi:hypothetical protein